MAAIETAEAQEPGAAAFKAEQLLDNPAQTVGRLAVIDEAALYNFFDNECGDMAFGD